MRTVFTVTREKTLTLTIGDTLVPRGHLYGLTPVDNILNNYESVHIVDREKLRSVCRHWSHPQKAAIAVVRL
ncbi:hypothetical protein FS593_22370 (plasmid) [Lelliottia amnigena]|nr:hypothetical protein FS593_22370 [Lelliottia amnigena]